MKIFISILAILMSLGMFGNKEQTDRNNCTFGFIVTILALTAVCVLR